MPVLSCGGMRYQFKWQDTAPEDIPPDNQANLEATIHRALELGINHIETARGYGTSEMQLGRLLPRLPRSKIIVQTKVSPQARPADFVKIFERSMKFLQLDYVDLLALHGINNRQLLQWSLGKNGCLAAARRLQKEGRARFIGFSTHATPDIILEAVESARVRLPQRALVFRQPFELAGHRRRSPPRHGRLHHQPQRQGRKTLRTAAQNDRLVRPPDPDAVQRSLLPGPARSPYLELRRRAPRRFR